MVVLAPLQMVGMVAEAKTDGLAVTLTVIVAVFEHPLLVPVTVYVVVDEGLTE